MTSEGFQGLHLKKKTVEAETVLIEFDPKRPLLVDYLTTVHNKNVLVMHKGEHRQYLADWIQNGIKGNFQDCSNPESLYKALIEVHKGKFWISRKDSEEFFESVGTRLADMKQSLNTRVLLSKISKKEWRIIHEIGQSEGRPLKEIAHSLFISDYTLRNHLTSIYKTLNLSNRIELYIFYQRQRELLLEISQELSV